MKKQFITYAKSIRFKILNDKMSRTEAIALFMLLMGLGACLCYIGSHFYQVSSY